MKTMRRRVTIASLVGLGMIANGAAVGGALSAQATGTGVEPPKVGCLRGRPLPACRSFWVIEMQGHTPLAQTTRHVVFGNGRPTPVHAFGSAVEWNIGHMANVTSSFALGGVLTAGSGGSDPLVGLKARGRRWLTPDVGLEVEGGLLRSDARYPTATGVTADLRFNIRDQGSFYLRWDGIPLSPDTGVGLLDSDPGGFQQALSVGLGAGSVPALIGSGALGLGYLILVAIFIGHAT